MKIKAKKQMSSVKKFQIENQVLSINVIINVKYLTVQNNVAFAPLVKYLGLQYISSIKSIFII